MGLKGRRFLLIGGAGFIGSRVADALLSEDVAELRICPRKAREELGFQAATELRQGLGRLIGWRAGHREAMAQRRRAAGLEA